VSSALEDLARIAEIEFSDIVHSTEMMESKMRVLLTDGGFVDVWLSRKLEGRFGFHWEQKTTGRSYRYDNFPDTKWQDVCTWPFHFHDGSQDNVVDSGRFQRDVTDGFRDFMKWVGSQLSGEEAKGD
jgi:hypothetical protein